MSYRVIASKYLLPEALTQLKKHVDVFLCNNLNEIENETFIQELNCAEGLIGFVNNIDERLLQYAPNLKIVSNVSVGYNNLDIDALTKRNIMATNTPDVLTDTVADLVFGLLIATARRITELDRYVKDGRWNEVVREEHFGIDVHHKTIGIIGMGRIGRAVAHRAHFGFHMDVLYYNRKRNKDAERQLNATYTNLDTLLKQSDYVVLMTPLTKETKHLLTYREFSLMKDTAIFINGSRGQTIVEADLIKALEEKRILGAGLDVFEKEPIEQTNPLLQMEQVVTTPHIGSATYETEMKMSMLAIKNLLAGLRGEKPPNLINQSVWNKIND